jgi:hypothetical protein
LTNGDEELLSSMPMDFAFGPSWRSPQPGETLEAATVGKAHEETGSTCPSTVCSPSPIEILH